MIHHFASHSTLIAPLRAAYRAIWEEMGYEVRMIADGQRLAENLGGLRCLTNALKRR